MTTKITVTQRSRFRAKPKESVKSNRKARKGTQSLSQNRHCERLRLSFSVGAEAGHAIAIGCNEAVSIAEKVRLLHVFLSTSIDIYRFAMTIKMTVTLR